MTIYFTCIQFEAFISKSVTRKENSVNLRQNIFDISHDILCVLLLNNPLSATISQSLAVWGERV